jgi:hypothetical protein
MLLTPKLLLIFGGEPEQQQKPQKTPQGVREKNVSLKNGGKRKKSEEIVL